MSFEERFGAIGRLLGTPGLNRVRAAHVCVIGVGGVGSWTVEALARSGIGAITLVDLDDVCITNINRQLPALDGQIGRLKIDVLAERVRLINPECELVAEADYFTEATADRLLAPRYDFVVDAIDRMSLKCMIIAGALSRGLPVLTVGGAGGKQDGCMVRTGDLADSEQDELLRQVRRKLRRDYGLGREGDQRFGVRCVYSPEKPKYPWADGSVCAEPEEGSPLALDCASGFGSAVFVTGVFGFAAAGEVVRRIAMGRPA